MSEAQQSKPEFYDQLPVRKTFDNLTSPNAYTPLPDDWFVGLADIVGSTRHIAEGRYKLVNTVGAAVISAQINGAQGALFPFVFGGDGSAFAFRNDHREKAADALAAVRRWAMDEFGLELRTAIVPIGTVRDAGHDVAVARFEASPGADYAMFAGGGISWAEKEMKSGRFDVPMAPKGIFPDLTGLSCRWTPMIPRHGAIVSLVILPTAEAAPETVAHVMHQIVEITESLERGGHPVAEDGPGYKWPPEGLELEARASHGNGSLFIRRLALLWETAVAWLFFRTGLNAGGFDPAHYVKTAGRNADFRKFEDGLKMTLDCDAETGHRLTALLDQAQEDNIISYGMVSQDSAVMTCIVPSIMTDDHIHFIDGAAGGYATAASYIKQATKHAT